MSLVVKIIALLKHLARWSKEVFRKARQFLNKYVNKNQSIGGVEMDDNWWPTGLKQFAKDNPLASDMVVVAEYSRPWDADSFFELYTALVPPEEAKEILSIPGEWEHNIRTSGPHPTYSSDREYVPTFRIWSGDVVPGDLEPIVVAWTGGDKKVLLPEQGFLMTYGLIPRTESGDVIHWDDLEKPINDVVIAEMVSTYHNCKGAKVSIRKDYLQDYATVRKLSLIQYYYASNYVDSNTEDMKVMGEQEGVPFEFPGRGGDLRKDPYSGRIFTQVWGRRPLLTPGRSPIIGESYDYGELSWPGIIGSVTRERARAFRPTDYVYVRDLVLKKYENEPEKYQVNPEAGAVFYKYQWGVSFCNRVGRDLIRLEIKKIYEGNDPDVVKHWHEFAVDPPTGDLGEMFRTPNVATRSKRIVYDFVSLGEAIADIANRVEEKSLTSMDFVKLDGRKLNDGEWWNDNRIRPITHHIPRAMIKTQFLDRCKRLTTLIKQGLSERNLRSLLHCLNVSPKSIEEYKSLKLLGVLAILGMITKNTSLDLFMQSEEIIKRYEQNRIDPKTGKHIDSPMTPLFWLNELRIDDAHGRDQTLETIEKYGIDPVSIESGWGLALDSVYDAVGDALEEMNKLFRECLYR